MVQIDELVIRVPGLDEAEGRQLGEEVARRLAARLPENMPDRQLASLNVRLSPASAADRSQLAEAIAAHILMELRYETM